MAKRELPADCARYITEELGRKLTEVLAHRQVCSPDELYYAVLMGDDHEMWTVTFVGKYQAHRTLGDYEEGGGAQLVGWDCLSDSDPWEHGEARFRNAPASLILEEE